MNSFKFYEIYALGNKQQNLSPITILIQISFPDISTCGQFVCSHPGRFL